LPLDEEGILIFAGEQSELDSSSEEEEPCNENSDADA
jgi:hypothetical protein